MTEAYPIGKFEFDILDCFKKPRSYAVEAHICEGDGMLLVAKEVGSNNGGEHFSIFGPKKNLEILKAELFLKAYKGLRDDKGGNGGGAKCRAQKDRSALRPLHSEICAANA